MSRKKAIDEWALDYWLLQRYAKLCFRIYFRKIEVICTNKIPLKQPVILAPNHQNALIDAMVLVCNLPFQIVFLARADIFKGKRLVKFLTFTNIMPIFRIRDGIENVKKNDAVFAKTVQVLHNSHNPLGLFAEGNHGDKRRIRPLVKGLFRIAFLAQEPFGDKPGVKIVPIGFDYGHYQHFRTTLFVNVGDPIEVSQFYNEYAENQVSAINRLKDAFAAALSKQMIDIQTEEYYDLYMSLRKIFNDDMKKVLGITERTLEAKFEADKVMIDLLNKELDLLPENISRLNEVTKKYQAGLEKFNLRDWVLKKKSYSIPSLLLSIIVKIVLFPLFLFGSLNNSLPYWFTASRVTGIKDTQFHSSFKYAVGMILFPVWYIVIAGILAFLSLPVGLILLYVLSLPLAGLAAFTYHIQVKKLWAKIRYTLSRNTPEMNALRNHRNEILTRMHDIINRQKNQQ